MEMVVWLLLLRLWGLIVKVLHRSTGACVALPYLTLLKGVDQIFFYLKSSKPKYYLWIDLSPCYLGDERVIVAVLLR